MSTEAPPISAPIDPARNAFIREVTKEPIGRLAHALHEKYPHVSPNHVTLTGLGLVMAGTRIGEWERKRENPRRSILVAASGVKLGGYALDAVDGALARATPGHNTDFGQVLDYSADRAQEADSAHARAKSATTRLGRLAARLAEVTCLFPGLARAHTEARGHVVPEHGRTVFEALGTRLGRVTSDVAQTVLPERGRTAVDVVVTAANIYTTIKRLQDGANADGEIVLSQKKIDQAKVRRATLAAQLAVTAGAVYLSSRRKH